MFFLDETHNYQLWITQWQGEDHSYLAYRSDIQSALTHWDWNEMGFRRFSEFISAWGLDISEHETVVDESYEGKCWIWCQKRTHQYEGGRFVLESE
jgi:hypothetical protein